MDAHVHFVDVGLQHLRAKTGGSSIETIAADMPPLIDPSASGDGIGSLSRQAVL